MLRTGSASVAQSTSVSLLNKTRPLPGALPPAPTNQAREQAKLNDKRRQALAALDAREAERDSLKYERICWEKLRCLL